MPFYPIPSLVRANPSDPTGTTSTAALVMMGLGVAGAGGGWSLTPQSTGRILFGISGIVLTNTTTDGAKWQLSYGTGAAPANGAALTGTQYGPINIVTSLVTSELAIPFSTHEILVAPPLTVGTAYWFDLALAAVTGGTAAVRTVSVFSIEI